MPIDTPLGDRTPPPAPRSGAKPARRMAPLILGAFVLAGLAACDKSQSPPAPSQPGGPPPMSSPTTTGTAVAGTAVTGTAATGQVATGQTSSGQTPMVQTPSGAAATLPSHDIAGKPPAPRETAKDSKSTDPAGTLTPAEERSGMPMAGHGNNHSSPSLEPGNPKP